MPNIGGYHFHNLYLLVILVQYSRSRRYNYGENIKMVSIVANVVNPISLGPYKYSCRQLCRRR